MSKFILITLMLLFISPVFAENNQSSKVYTEEDLNKYRSTPDAVYSKDHETIEEYKTRREEEQAAKDAYYIERAVEIERICREESRHKEQIQQLDDIMEEIAILRGNLAVQKYGAYPGVKVAPDQTRKRFVPQEFYYKCLKNSGIPPEYFGFDRWE